ncbi:MAG: hypothetical protein JO001_13925 [Alphaproteobacteria bacterium]|nr:hypothetical protein [Alphaproteobacteria bacterium]
MLPTIASLVSGVAFAAGPPPGGPPAVDPGQLAGNTLSAVAFVPHSPGDPGGGELQRIMLQAYLAPNGGAVVRRWMPERNSYSVPVRAHWSLEDSKLCIDSVTAAGTAPLCATVHVWWPRIAGIGTQPYAMLDGDLQRGDIITGNRLR